MQMILISDNDTKQSFDVVEKKRAYFEPVAILSRHKKYRTECEAFKY